MNVIKLYPNAGTTKLSVGLLLCFKDSEAVPLRITHVFEHRIYVTAYTTPEAVRTARKPRPLPRAGIQKDLDSGRCRLAKAALPPELFRTHPSPGDDAKSTGTEEPVSTAHTIFQWIAPLIEHFDVESNLARRRFTALVQARADELQMNFLTLRRLVLRFYYFGRVAAALTPLVSGPAAGIQKSTNASKAKMCAKYEANSDGTCHRRGRQPVLSKKLGPNMFVVGDKDVADMVLAAKRAGRRQKGTLLDAHDDYLKTEFARRHPALFKAWIEERCPEPVTYDQFRKYTKAHKDYEQEVLDNLPALAGNDPGRSSHSAGPGEMSEIDATGGRIHLVAEDEAGELVHVGTPWIYLLIDRWSRFIISVYVTLGFPSWEEIRYALLIAFTPREARFRSIGAEVSEARWPQGRMCSAIAQDRGSELKCISNLEATAGQFRIELVTLPPLTPDGKAIIERTIRDLKKSMASSGLSGVYVVRPIDPKSKKASRKAATAAATSLREVYRAVLEVVDRKNNSPHRSLKKNLVLTQAGVRPIPREAYLWGCRNLTGAKVTSLTEEDMQRMLMSVGKGSIANSRVAFRSRAYEPADAEARAIANASTKRPKAVELRFDKTFREEIYVVSQSGRWSLWRMTAADRLQIQGVTMDEEEMLIDVGALLWATAANRSKIERVSSGHGRPAARREPARHGSRAETVARRGSETRALKESLTERVSTAKSPVRPSKTVPPAWRQLEATERLASINRTRQRKSHDPL